jgi:curved DNA-binding protein CbpA
MTGVDRKGAAPGGATHMREPTPLTQAEMDDLDAMLDRVGRGLYALLGLARDADRPAVRAAYFELMKRYHPDVFWERDLGLYRPRVEALFRELTAAFEVLCDPHRRSAYDEAQGPVKAPSPLPPMPSTASPSRGSIVPPPTTSGTHDVGARRSDVGLSSPPARERLRSSSDRPPPLSERPPRRSNDRPSRSTSEVPPPMPEERVPREITLQSLMRSRSEHLAKQRRERVAELEERIRQAEIRNEAGEVLTLLREAAGLAPDDAGLRSRLAQAEAAASTVLFERYRNYARVCEKDQRWEPAVEAWIRASDQRPDDVALLLSVVNASCEGLIDLPRAAEYARRATQLDAQSADAFALQARVFLLAGRMASARGAVENALRIAPSHASAVELARRLNVKVR